jgi:hypothetical protein
MTEQVVSNKELEEMIKGGAFFHFCCAFALNKGFKYAIEQRKEAQFSVGDYEVKFIPEPVHFELNHKVYFARIIHAYFNGAEFIGDNEEEVIQELLTEFKKEI